MSSPTRTIFDYRDLLDEIFSWLSPRDLKTTVRVNSLWFTASVPKLWRVIDLLDVVDHLSSVNGEPIHIINWERYAVYTASVRILRGGAHDAWAFESLRESRRGVATGKLLFPNCESLSWAVYEGFVPSDFDLLISPRLKDLSLNICTLDPIWLSNVCNLLISRVSALRLFDLRVSHQVMKTTQSLDPLQRLLTVFKPSLRNLHIPHAIATGLTLTQSRDLLELRELIVDLPDIDASSSPDFTDFIADGKDFDTLQILSLCLPNATAFINNVFSQSRFSHLTVLNWTLFKVPEHVGYFFDTIVKACPELQVLHLARRQYSQPTVIPWEFVRRLLDCRKLSALTLQPFKVSMDHEDFVRLLRSRTAFGGWRILEVFTVNPLRLQGAMLLLAQHCPNLRYLGLHACSHKELELDVTTLPRSLWLHSAIHGPSTALTEAELMAKNVLDHFGFPFPRLAAIDFAYSKFKYESAWDIAVFLATIHRHPIYIGGQDKEYWDAVNLDIKRCYTIAGSRNKKIPSYPPARTYLWGHRFLKAVIVPAEWDFDGCLMADKTE